MPAIVGKRRKRGLAGGAAAGLERILADLALAAGLLAGARLVHPVAFRRALARRLRVGRVVAGLLRRLAPRFRRVRGDLGGSPSLVGGAAALLQLAARAA